MYRLGDADRRFDCHDLRGNRGQVDDMGFAAHGVADPSRLSSLSVSSKVARYHQNNQSNYDSS